MFHDVSLVDSHQCTKPPDDTRRNVADVADPTLTVSKVSVWLLVDWDHVPPDVRFAYLAKPVLVVVVAVVVLKQPSFSHNVGQSNRVCSFSAPCVENVMAPNKGSSQPSQPKYGCSLHLDLTTTAMTALPKTNVGDRFISGRTGFSPSYPTAVL